jgi:hypothetical protein
VLLVTPGARAGRRLLELIVGGWELEAGNASRLAPRASRLISPPRRVLVGALPELLYERETPLASELEALLARLHTLRTTPAGTLGQVFAALPEEDDVPGWLQIASELEALDSELAAENLACAAVRAHCAARGLSASANRWRVLDDIAQRTADALHEVNRISRFHARRAALEKNLWRQGCTVVLACTADIPRATCALLAACGCRVLSLVHAPAEHAAGFDEFGRIVPEYWHEQPVPLAAGQLRIVEHPRDQAAAVRELIESLKDVEPSRVVVGLGDEGASAMVARAIEQSGRPARRATNREFAASPPARLLALLAEYSSDRRPEAWAALMRHPDLEEWLSHVAHVVPPAGGWVAALDCYQSEHLPATLHTHSPRLGAELRAALEAVARLLPPPHCELQLGEWPPQIAALISEIYAGREYEEHNPDDAAMTYALSLLGDVLRAMEELGPEHPHAPQLAFADTVRLLLALAGAQPIPEPGGEPAIELLGWLEVPLDDAPVLALAGLNEGFIPESRRAAPFLPDGLRRELGLPDNAQRYARDAYFLTAIKHSRPLLLAICGKRTAQNDPLAPSRLLFACQPEEVVRRALEFYGDEQATCALPALLPHGTEYALATIPRPAPCAEPMGELPVTAFRDYLACPYRFYLKHVCRLEAAAEDAPEMDGSLFGDLMHGVLSDFGRWVIGAHDGFPPTDAEATAQYLEHCLRRHANARFGQELLPAVEIQLHQLARRLAAFARCQAEQMQESWQIVHIEKPLRHEFSVDGSTFSIFGRADRIDRHPASGRFRIWDYKSSDSGEGPEQVHRVRDGDAVVWRDLQLPLYRRLAQCLEIDEHAVEVGYICLPRELEKTRFEGAAWDEACFEEAYTIAESVIRSVRAQVFWPPSATPPRYDDGFAAICLDHSLDRARFIADCRS